LERAEYSPARASAARPLGPCSLCQRRGVAAYSWSVWAAESRSRPTSGPKSFTSCRLAPATISESGAPRPSTSRLRLVPFFPPVGRVVPHRLLRQRSFALRAVQALPFPCDAFHLVVLRQPGAPQAHEEPFLLPPLEVVMNGAGAAETLGQSLPLAAGAEHIHDGGKNIARRHRFASAARPPAEPALALGARIASRQQRLDPRPKPVGYFPRLDSRHGEIMAEAHIYVNCYLRISSKCGIEASRGCMTKIFTAEAAELGHHF